MNKKILIIEDDALVAKSLERLLAQEGYNAATAESCKEAMETLQYNNFDLIISDIRMPEVDGVETIKRIREFLKQKGQKQIPEIFITGYAEGESHDLAKKLKTSDFLYKPFDKDQFLKSIETALRS